MSFLNYTYRLYPTKKECIKINQIKVSQPN